MSMRDDAIAVVGMGAMLPGGPSVAESWQMILEKRSQIREVPRSRWDADIYFDPELRAPYKTNSKIGSFLEDDIGFRPRDFGMPPILADHLDPTQQLALLVARQALEDAGATDKQPRNWAVIVGNLLGGSWKRGEQWIRTHHIKTEHQIRTSRTFHRLSGGEKAELIEALRLEMPWSNQPVMTPDSLPGLLGNLIASRIAHFFNLTGPNFTVDAACATSLSAIEQAVMGLRLRRYDAALAGGVDRIMDASSFIGFSKMGVLSPDGSYPFDARANGFVMGEGAVLFVLKRLEDALAQGDPIYGQIVGVGSSTDGRGRAIAAPNPHGQSQAIERAYADAGVSPETVDLLECHGTSTPIGDPTEIAGLRAVWSKTGRTKPVAIGSIKSNLGHLKGAAGAAALFKGLMGLHEKILPPQIQFETPNPRCEFESTPFAVQTEAAPWESSTPRRCGVSAFGFGGINYHLVLEEAPMDAQRPTLQIPGHRFESTPKGALPLGLSLVAFGAESREALAQRATELRQQPFDPEGLRSDSAPVAAFPWRAAFFAPDQAQRDQALEMLHETLSAGKSMKKLEAKGIYVREGEAIEGKVAFLFPGQGSQYVGMMGELRERFPVVKETLEEADRVMAELLPKPLSEYMCPGDGVEQGAAFFELLQTEVLQPAVLAADTALWRLLSPWFDVQMVMGHSLGEYGAAIAAGVFSFADALKIVAARGEAIAAVADHMDDVGMMIGVGADAETVEALLHEQDEGYVIVANKNCPTQTIIAGASDATSAAAKRLEAKGFDTVQLPVSHAFHSEIVSPASPFLLAELEKIEIHPPQIELLSNVTAKPYPTDAQAPQWIRDTLSVHLARPVEWQKMVEYAYDQGFRYFVEVGPKRALSTFVKDILKDRPHAAYFSAHPKFGELNSLGRMFAALIADGQIPYGEAPVERPQKQSPQGRETMAKTSFPPLGIPQKKKPTNSMRSWTDQPAATSWTAEPASQPSQLPPQSPAPQAPAAPQMGYGPVAYAPVAYGAPYMPFADPGFWQYLAMYHAPLYHSLHAMMASYQAMRMMPLPQMMPMPQMMHHHPPMAPAMPMAQVMPQQMAPMAPMPPMHQTPHVTAPPATAPPSFAAPPTPAMGQPRPVTHETPTSSYAPVAPPFDASSLRVPEGGPYASSQTLAYAPATIASMPAFEPTGEPPTELSLEQRILEIVADRTGYGVDELGLDEHLEADLGIDSIRQVEVMAEVRDLFQLPRDDDFNIGEYTTLRALIDYVESMRGHGAKEEAADDDGASG